MNTAKQAAYAIISLLAITAALPAASEPVTEPPNTGRVVVHLDTRQLSRLTTNEYRWADVLIWFRNKLNVSEPEHRLSIAYSDYEAPSTANELYSPRAVDLKPGKQAFQLRNSDVIEITNNNATPIQLVANDLSGLRIDFLNVPYGNYEIEIRAYRRTKNKETAEIFRKSQTSMLSAGQTVAIVAKKPSLWEAMFATALTPEAGAVTTIGALIAALLAATKKQLETLWAKLLEVLGKYGVYKLAARRFRDIYREYLITGHKYLKLVGFNVAGLPRPLLEDVFISLRVGSYGSLNTDRSDPDALVNQSALGSRSTEQSSQTVSFIDAVRRFRYLVILGAPGAGKTTALSYILLQFANGTAHLTFRIAEPLLPLYIPLRRLTEKSRSIIADMLDPETQILPDDVLRECPKDFYENSLAKGSCIVLLDGLDEVKNEESHRAVSEKINALVARYPNNRYVVTCRVAGWRGLLPQFSVLEADELNREEIHRFIRGWHNAVITLQERNRIEQDHADPTIRAGKWSAISSKLRLVIDDYARRLLNAIEGNARILAISANPMLLSLICLIHYNRNILPRGRPVLYAQCVELLIDVWERSKGLLASASPITASQKELILREIAFEMHMSGRGELHRDELVRLTGRILTGLNILIPATEVLEDIERRSGLLVERSIDVLGFSHLTLQEYLVAKHVNANVNLVEKLVLHMMDREWREVVLLYAGLIDDATDLVRKLLEGEGTDQLFLAAHAIGEAQRVDQVTCERVIAGLIGEVGVSGDNVDGLTAAFAAVAADFSVERSMTPEQKLSAQLGTWLGGDERRSRIAIGALGRARITRLLPELVELALRDGAIGIAAANTVVLFGNLALEEIETQVARARVPVSLVVRVLYSISTGSSAVVLAKLYNTYGDADDRKLISGQLAIMMKQPLVELELREVAGEWLEKIDQSPAEKTVWYPVGANSAGFIKLYNRLIRDLAEIFVDDGRFASLRDQTKGESPAFRASFSAVLEAIRRSRKPLSEEVLSFLGWNIVNLRQEGTSVEGLCNAIRRDANDMAVILRRARAGSARLRKTVRENPFENWIRRGLDVTISVLAFSNAAFCGVVSWELLNRSSVDEKDYIIGGILSGSVAAYLALVVWGLIEQRGSLAWRAILGAVVTPVQRALLRVPRASWMHPWVVFALLMVGLIAMSVPGVVDGYRIFGGGSGDSGEVLLVLNLVALGFAACSAVYLQRYALSLGAPSLLLVLHPLGVELVYAG